MQQRPDAVVDALDPVAVDPVWQGRRQVLRTPLSSRRRTTVVRQR